TITATLPERASDRDDSRRLLLGETRVPYRRRNLRLRRFCDFLRGDGPDPRPEVLETAAFVGDGRALRQNRRDEDLERRHPAAPILDRVTGLEGPHRAHEGTTVHALERVDGRKGCVTRSQRSGSS